MRTNEALNKAIWKVLVTKFKKDAKEAFEMVQDNGYEVCKNGSGFWEVCNRKNHRYIRLADRGYGRYAYTVIQHGPYTSQSHRLTDNEWKAKSIAFDFVGCLEKPVNQTWYDMQNQYKHKQTALEKYEELRMARRMAKSYAADIEKTQQEIEKLQKRLVSQVESKVRYEQKVQTLRRQFGLA